MRYEKYLTMTEAQKSIIKETRNRAEFFQSVHAWPLNDNLNYLGWLKNFKTDEELKLACLIVDFFIYYPDKMVNQMLETSIGYAGQHLVKILKDWKHEDFFNRCYYSFIPGETNNPSDSGRVFLRKLRDTLSIPESRFLEYNDIPQQLSMENRQTPIILVDDFVGSGAQCDKAWNRNKFSFNNKTLREIEETENHIFVYAPLVVNIMGLNRIKHNCPSLILTPAHVLGNEYNLFHKDCFCWKSDDALFRAGTDLILNKSKELGIPFLNGEDPQDVRGFGEQGLAIAFEHGAPDAIPSLFYWQHKNWTPLINKSYAH